MLTIPFSHNTPWLGLFENDHDIGKEDVIGMPRNVDARSFMFLSILEKIVGVRKEIHHFCNSTTK